MNTEIEESAKIIDLVAHADLERATSKLMDYCEIYGEKDDKKLAVNIKREYSQIRKDIIAFGPNGEIRNREGKVTSDIVDLLDIIKEKNIRNPELKTLSSESKKIDLYKKNNTEKNDKAVVELNKIEKKYSNFELIIENVKIYNGEIIGVVGQNGSGKSTLLKILAGMINPSKGDIIYNINTCESIDWLRLKQDIFYLPQDIPLRGNICISDYLKYYFSANNILGVECTDLVEKVITRLNLEDHKLKAWNTLSGGYKLRLELAKVFGLKPPLIILDEPLANLDVVSQTSVLNDIVDISKASNQKSTLVITSQHLFEIELIADKILYLERGNLIFFGSKKELENLDEFYYIEFAIDLKYDVVNKIISDFYKDFWLHSNGFRFQLRIHKKHNLKTLISNLSEKSSPLLYYRDITGSIKRYFKDAII